jgi:hypothetical protein
MRGAGTELDDEKAGMAQHTAEQAGKPPGHGTVVAQAADSTQAASTITHAAGHRTCSS